VLDLTLDQGKIDPRLVQEYGECTHAVQVQKSIPHHVVKAVRSSVKRAEAGKTMWNPTVIKRVQEKLNG
jgi:hypothetical protein